jgi:hypothetical protein
MESELAAGTILGGNKWRIASVIGRGACGVVYSVTPHTPALQAIAGTTRYVAKCIPHGANLSKAKKKEQEKLAHTLNLEMNLLAPGKLLADFKYRPKLPFEHYYGKCKAVPSTLSSAIDDDDDVMLIPTYICWCRSRRDPRSHRREHGAVGPCLGALGERFVREGAQGKRALLVGDRARGRADPGWRGVAAQERLAVRRLQTRQLHVQRR